MRHLLVNKGEYMKEIMWNIRNIRFVSFDEVYDNRDEFRKEVLMLDSDSLEIYKWYYYHQLCLMTSKKAYLKELLWEYLSSDHISLELRCELARQYRIYKRVENIQD